MENNNYDESFLDEIVQEQAHVEAPAMEAPAEPVAEPVVEAPVQALGFTETGAIGSMAADGPKPMQSSNNNSDEKIALYSTKNARWEEVGTIYKGYNIVTKDQLNKWLSRSHVRIAEPEEIKKAFG